MEVGCSFLTGFALLDGAAFSFVAMMNCIFFFHCLAGWCALAFLRITWGRMMLHWQKRWECWCKTARSCLSLNDEMRSPKFSTSCRALNVKLFWSDSNASWKIENKISLGFWKALLLKAVDLHLLITGWTWTPLLLIAALSCLMEEPRNLQKCLYGPVTDTAV